MLKKQKQRMRLRLLHPRNAGVRHGSDNTAPDVYAALLERMTQLEQTLTRPPPPESSTGGTPETPPQGHETAEAKEKRDSDSQRERYRTSASTQPSRPPHGAIASGA